jgi:pimeloyl-ACP methyl ester carboxylesterase
LPFYAPSRANDEVYKAWWARLQRLGASPGAACALLRMNFNIDIADVLPTIKVPTLVMHRTGDRICRVEGGRYTAERIPGAKYVEMPDEAISPGPAIRTPSSRRCRSSLPARARGRSLTAYWQLSS